MLSDTHFDVIVIGGGISGAWIACQLSSLGKRVALLERKDFASETSSASSKLLHGGIRYLQQLQFGKVRESTLERAEYLAAAPHLAQAVPFVVPTYKDLKRSKALLHCGMLAYKTLGIGQHSRLSRAGVGLPHDRTLSQHELLELCNIDAKDLTGAVAFPEFHLYDSERTVWAILATAMTQGAVAANYTNVEELVTVDGVVTGVRARLQEHSTSIEIKASLVVNAAGPWVDRIINSKVSSETTGPGTTAGTQREASVLQDTVSTPSCTIQGYATGAHLVTRQLVADHAIAITTRQQSNATIDRGGRHIFIIPWRGMSLIGTSYRETEDPDHSKLLLQEDIDQLLEAVNDALPSVQLAPEDVISAYSGLYPLRVERIKKGLYQGSGEYLVIDHAQRDQLEGLVTALGAKYTTARLLAVKTTELCLQKLHDASTCAKHPSSTGIKRVRLSCARYDYLEELLDEQQRKLSHRFSNEQIFHLVRCYGSQIDDFIAFIDASSSGNDASPVLLDQRIIASQPDILGQVAWAVEHELALHLDDVLLRRTSIDLLGIDESGLHEVASLMANRLNWSKEQVSSEIAAASKRHEDIRAAVGRYYDSHQASAG